MPFGARGLSLACVAICLSGCAAPRVPVATHIVISPTGVLLTEDFPTRLLAATVFDDSGAVLDSEVEWSSSAEAAISVSPDGLVEANAPVGSAVITAKVGAIEGQVLVIAAQPVEGAVVVTDENIVGLPQADDPAAEFGVGFQYSVTLVGVAQPALGTILLTNGSKPVSGKVIAVDANVVTLEVVPIDEVFGQLDIDASIDVSAAPFSTPEDVDASFSVDRLPNGSTRLRQRPDVTLTSSVALTPQAEFGAGAFRCETELSAVQVSLAQATVTFNPNLTYDIAWNDDQRKIIVSGSPKVTLDVSPVLTAAIDGKVTCKLTFREFHIPVPGPLGLLIAAVVPVGAGFELSGKVPIAQVGVQFKGEVGATFQYGFDCAPDCTGVQSLTPTVDGTVTPILPASLSGLKVEAGGYGFLFVKLEGGARFSTTLRVEAIEAAAGLKFEAKLASEETQAADGAYASEYELLFEASIGAGSGFQRFLDLVRVTVAKLEFKVVQSIAKSPRGTVTADRSDFSVGDTVNFTIGLDPDTLTFPVIGPNVESIRVYRKTGDSLTLANEVAATIGQSELVVPWVATVDGTVQGSFVAFVKTHLPASPRLELGPVTAPGTNSATFTFSAVEERHDEVVNGPNTVTTDYVETLTASFQLELVSETPSLMVFDIISGTANHVTDQDYVEVTLNGGSGDCTYNERIEDHWSTTGSTQASGQLTLSLTDGEYDLESSAQILPLVTTGVWSVEYTFLGPRSDCRSNVTDPYESEDEDSFTPSASGTVDPSSPNVYAGTEVTSDTNFTRTTTWSLQVQ